jgi:hypothetical protein
MSIPELAWEERSDWINVRTDVTPAAVGDGLADDTPAIQAALDMLGKEGTWGQPLVAYLPPGTYRITETLRIEGPALGLALIGHGRTTRLVWDAAPPDPNVPRLDDLDALRGGVATPPTGVRTLGEFLEGPTDWRDSYCCRLTGYLRAPQTGAYVFWVAGDDQTELWLSDSTDKGTQRRIARVDEWTGPRQWDKFPTQKSEPVELVAGRLYHVEVLMKEGGGGDNVAVGWRLPDGTEEKPIPASRVLTGPRPDAPAGAKYEWWDYTPPAEPRMLVSKGAAYSRYVGIVFDGRKRAKVGLDHAANRFETEVDHRHLAFVDLTEAGIRVGRQGTAASAEMIISNCLFERCGSGLAFHTFNDYDNVIDGCEFRDCGVGVFQGKGANFYLRNSHFARSTDADVLSVGPEHPCSVRRCTSVESRKFLRSYGGVSPLSVQDCHVEGWTAPDGAVTLADSPVLMFDCSFRGAPGDHPPVRLEQRELPLVHSNLVSPETKGAITPVDAPRAIEVPPGERGPGIESATRRFLKSNVRIPGKVFDARRDFGAAGDGSTDDTAALQATIDAAREHGRDAIAYLPSGRYVVSKTLEIGGSDYYVGGTGFRTAIDWIGPEGGTIVAVRDPERVVLENVAVGVNRGDADRSAVDILHSATRPASTMYYENVHVYGMYAKKPFRKGLRIVGLAKGATVVGEHVTGNTRVIDSSRGTVLFNVGWEAALIVEGKNETVRDGFLGVLTRFNSNEPYGLYVKDNQSVVITDYYTEQTEGWLSIAGGPGMPEGRVTIVAVKSQQDKNPGVVIEDYAGRIAMICVQHYQAPDPRDYVHTGTRPLDLMFIANKSYDPTVKITCGPGARLTLLGNMWKGPADTVTPDALRAASRALDDLRELGAMDLELNHAAAPGP